jgi:hypothetical protein
MRPFSVVMFCALALLCASTAWAQPGPGATDSAEEMRRQIRLLEGKLRNIEDEQAGDSRVAELGGTSSTRLRGREPDMVVRLYDLSDLFTVAPSYPAVVSSDLGQEWSLLFPARAAASVSGAMGGMGGGYFRVNEQPRSVIPRQPVVLQQNAAGQVESTRSSLEDLIGAITSTINPTSWDDVGGQGSIAPLGTSLLISNDMRTHEQIESLLEQLRKRWGTLRTVSVCADWLWLTPAQLEGLLVVDEAPKPDGIAAFGLVDEAAWKRLREPAGRKLNDRSGYQAVVTCYNGQTVSTLAGQQRLVVANVAVESSAQAANADGQAQRGGSKTLVQPKVSVVQEGAALQVTPTTNVSGKFVILDIHSRVALVDMEQGRAGAGDAAPIAAAVAGIDRPLLNLHRISTTMRVPVDRRILTGGMTYQSEPRADEPNLYLFVKLHVQELRDDLPTTKVGAQPANLNESPQETTQPPAHE